MNRGGRGPFLPALVFFASAATLWAAPPVATPTYCAELVTQSTQGFDRLTLFTDRTLIWKSRRSESDDLKRKALDAEEAKFYCDYFARPDLATLPEDERSHVTGELVHESVLRLARPDGSVKEILFDEFSALPPETSALRSAMEGLRNLFSERIAPASRFTPSSLAPGTVLKRFDGELFRVLTVDEAKGVVQLEGVAEPYSLYRKISDLRFFFHPPGE